MDILEWTWEDIHYRKINRKGPGRRKIWITYIKNSIRNGEFLISSDISDEDSDRMKALREVGIEKVKNMWKGPTKQYFIRRHWYDNTIGLKLMSIHKSVQLDQN